MIFLFFLNVQAFIRILDECDASEDQVEQSRLLTEASVILEREESKFEALGELLLS